MDSNQPNNRSDPDKFVEENRDLLVHVLKHGDNEFVRAFALAALVEYGNEAELEDIQRELEHARGKKEEKKE